jgi:preprotein translocase subunit SecD
LRDGGAAALKADGKVSILKIDATSLQSPQSVVNRLTKLLTTPGKIEFRIVPHGDIYRSPAGATVESAMMGYAEDGAPAVMFRTTDPVSFRRFTSAHLHKDLGIFLDGHLLSAPMLAGPIDRDGEIEGNFSIGEAEFIAAVIGAPLPTRVELQIAARTQQRN